MVPVALGGQDVGSVTVRNTTSMDGGTDGVQSSDATASGDGGQPAPGIVGAALGLLAGVALLRYRS